MRTTSTTTVNQGEKGAAQRVDSINSTALGARFIPATQRPDGTWRKPRKVKDGYVPQEEVPLYESKGKMFMNSRPQYPVGLSPELIAAAEAKKNQSSNNPIPGLVIQPQDVKTGKKKKKKKAGGQGDDLSDALSKTSLSSEALLSSNHRSSDTTSLDTEWKTAGSKGKSKRGNVPTEGSSKARGNAPPPAASQSAPKQAAKSAPVAKAPGTTETATDPAKRLKNLRKKLREIETIEQKIAAGAKLEKDQLDKISRKDEIMQEIDELEF